MANGIDLQARYRRSTSRRRRGKKSATTALAHAFLIMDYHIVKEQCAYNGLGADYFDRLNEQYLVKRLTLRIKMLGYQVKIKKGLAAT